jgi:D-alanyl-D-alanine carboxypeptidase
MPTRRSILAGTAAATLAATVGAAPRATAAPAAAAVPDRAALQAALDQIVATGATAALARVDTRSGTWHGASGVVELGRPAPAPAWGRFRVGSVTKTFVATVLLQLVGEGRLSLADTLEQWLPGAIPNGDRISLRNLLQHTSGVFDYTEILFATVEDVLAVRYRTLRPEELVAIAASQPPRFEPGTSWEYSNTNYVLLGLIVERVTRRPYAAQVRARILRPLGLRDTTLPGTRIAIHGPHAHGYEPIVRDGELVPLDFTELNPSMAYSAGEIISTTADLNRFYRALLRGRLLRPAQLAEMLGHPTGDLNYGLGIFQQTLRGGPTLWGHSGSIFGYLTYAFSTADTATQLSVSINPWLGDFGPALESLALTAFGVAAPARTGAPVAEVFPVPDRRFPGR